MFVIGSIGCSMNSSSCQPYFFCHSLRCSSLRGIWPEFWKLVADLSEPNGNFRADNLLSNESRLQYVVPELTRMKAGGTYLGVGPEQNFTLIAAIRPSTAFIIDIRRGNLQLHLLYKAVFELSAVGSVPLVPLIFAVRRIR